MKKIVSGMIVTASLVAGFSLTTAAFAYGTGAVLYSDEGMTEVIEHEKTDYGVNENGQTFGSALSATYVEDMPDLVLAIGDHGKEGYIYLSDLLGETPSSPEEAVQKQLEREQNGGGDLQVCYVYESDGKTIIDTLTASATE